MFFHCQLVILILVLTLDGQEEAVPHSRPYMVLLEEHMRNGQKRYCGGFLLNEDFVMTAAHCQGRSYKVLLGLHDFQDKNGVQIISVEQTFPHIFYDETNLKNDIMLLKLSSKAKFSDKVRPIALAGPGDGLQPKSCIVSGWGKTDENKRYMSFKLMEDNVTLINNPLCAKENMYCSEGRIGPHHGDAGIPLVCEDGKAYGVASGIFKPASGDLQIHRYTKIPDYRSWIDSIIENVLRNSDFICWAT
ncbi:granzyme G-like [Epinephelus fuscoguttatus]|uniref:granzyme G-like n=1 Tax=Epinephelus fuscoguttatus TaxID=293821 RepID=UPI0020D0B8C3|nr:granzyme G-like [Epinephelus fuscoguttatus]